MTNDSVSVPSSGSHDAETARPNITPRVEARWEKPLIAASGGEATLLVRISAATEDETETSRAAPLDVAFVLDRSGSMQGGKLDLAKEGLIWPSRGCETPTARRWSSTTMRSIPCSRWRRRRPGSRRVCGWRCTASIPGDRRTSPEGGSPAAINSPRRRPSPCGCHGNAYPARHPAHRWLGKRRHSRSGDAGAACGRATAARHRHDHRRRGTGLRRGAAQRHG